MSCFQPTYGSRALCGNRNSMRRQGCVVMSSSKAAFTLSTALCHHMRAHCMGHKEHTASSACTESCIGMYAADLTATIPGFQPHWKTMCWDHALGSLLADATKCTYLYSTSSSRMILLAAYEVAAWGRRTSMSPTRITRLLPSFCKLSFRAFTAPSRPV